jgi:Icc-related predicted phosphoesterase
VLITHGPPYGILDFNMRGDLCGSQSLYHAVIQKQPRIHFFGHIHQASGILEFNNTKFVNAAVLNDWYNMSFDPKVIEIELRNL